jgi:RNA polymerase sigma-70 factor, ECF subfamily
MQPNMPDFITHMNSSVSSEPRPGNQLAITKIKCETMRIQRRGDAAMNCVKQVVPIENLDELATTRDDPLVTALQAGLPGAFSQLYTTYSLRLYRTIIGITKNPEDAQDALQETFLRAHLRVHAFEGRSGIYSWLSRIAMNSAFMILRKRRARPEVLFDPQPGNRSEMISFEPKDPAPNPEEACDLRQRQVKASRAIYRLDPTLLAPFRMQIKHGWSVREISHALNISETAVKSRLYRARQRLSATRTDLKCSADHHPLSLSEFAGRDSVSPALSNGMSRKSHP